MLDDDEPPDGRSAARKKTAVKGIFMGPERWGAKSVVLS